MRIWISGLLRMCLRSLAAMRPQFWHCVSPGDFLFFHNLRVGQGLLHSASVISRSSGLHEVGSPYSIAVEHLHQSRDKESTWEEVRTRHFPGRPSRLKVFYVFDRECTASEANTKWWNGSKLIVPCHPMSGSNIHRADTVWLDCQPAQYEVNANRYWRGEMSSAPLPEVIVDGSLYFPQWKDHTSQASSSNAVPNK